MSIVKNIIAAGALASALVAGFSVGADAADKAKAPNHYEWKFNGPFGTYDRAAAQRGFQVFQQVCSGCHSLNYFRFRNLADIGFNEDEIKVIASQYEVEGEPDDYGDPTFRAALPQDAWPAPYPNEQAGRAANGGALPPDLSVITRARHHGADYIKSLLTGYEDTPEDKMEKVGDKYYNPYFPGDAIAMSQPLYDDLVEYEDGTSATMDQMATDVVMFLNYVADPHLETRHNMGVATILFLLVLTVLLYFSKQKIWKPVKEGRNVVAEAAAKEEG